MKTLQALKPAIIGTIIGLLLASGLLVLLNESPTLLVEAFSHTLFTQFGLGYTLFYLTPLILTGLSVAISFHCGLFNIGAEGQLYMGSLAIVFVSHLFPTLPYPLSILLGICAAALAGGLWGMVAGLLKALRGTHEVIVTILLNFIGISLVEYCILYPLKNQDVQNTETIPIGPSYHLSLLSEVFEKMGLSVFVSTPVNTALVVAVLLCFLTWFFLYRTPLGFELRAAGFNPVAARFAGIPLKKRIILSFFLSGALAGLVGVNEVMGHEYKLQQGFSPGYGFTGIAVALVARNHPIGIILSGLLFSVLQNSAREIEFLSEKVTKELSVVIQAVLIIFIAARFFWNRSRKS